MDHDHRRQRIIAMHIWMKNLSGVVVAVAKDRQARLEAQGFTLASPPKSASKAAPAKTIDKAEETPAAADETETSEVATDEADEAPATKRKR